MYRDGQGEWTPDRLPVARLLPYATTDGIEAGIARGELFPPERPTGVLSGRLLEPLEGDFGASKELMRLRDLERW